MDELISKEVAIDTLKAVRDLVWDVDIPSPTVPEYIEHHEQMQSIMRNIDILTDKIIKMPSVQPEIVRCRDCKYYQTDKCYIHIERIWELKPDDYCSQGERDE